MHFDQAVLDLRIKFLQDFLVTAIAPLIGGVIDVGEVVGDILEPPWVDKMKRSRVSPFNKCSEYWPTATPTSAAMPF